MRKTWVEYTAGIICLIILLSSIGCVGKTQYTIKTTYVNSVSDKEVRTIDVNLDQSSYWKNAIFTDFPRTIKLINDEFIWKFKK